MPIIYNKKTEMHEVTVRYPNTYICDGCGATSDDGEQDWDWLPVILELGFIGEEGWGRVEKIFCYNCWYTIVTGLLALGLGSHWHGGTNFLEDLTCPGASANIEDGEGKCPTPEGYGGGPFEDD